MNLVFLRQRYSNPNTGRFVTQDAFEGDQFDPLSLHKYLYCKADPLNRIDPSGDDSGTLVERLGVTGIIGLTAALYLGVVAEQKTHAVGTLLTAAGQGGADLLDESSSAAQQAAAAAEAAIASHYRSLHDAIKAAKQILKKAGNVLKSLKVVPIPTKIMRSVARNVKSAQNAGHPVMLTRVNSVIAKANRRAALAGRGSAGFGKSWDEYPFASGKPPGTPPAQVRPVPVMQNWLQGGIISACYRLEKINVGNNYFVVVIP